MDVFLGIIFTIYMLFAFLVGFLKLFGIDLLKEKTPPSTEIKPSDKKKDNTKDELNKTGTKEIKKTETGDQKINEQYHPIITGQTQHKKTIIDPKSPWGKLRKQVLERDKYTCQGYKCGSKKNLSVHHIVPVSLGGKNNLTNLITLCLECHEKTHNNNFTSRKIKGDLRNYGNDVQLSKKIILLSDAIDNQEDVEIDYINFDKAMTHRIIKPNNIAYGDHNLKIYVYAYCYMRKALRTFRISRMSNLKVVS